MIFFTRRAFSSAARPVSAFPALLLTMVRSRAPRLMSASISSAGMPAPPNPPIMTVAPSWTSATACSIEWTILSIMVSSTARRAGAALRAMLHPVRRRFGAAASRRHHRQEVAAHPLRVGLDAGEEPERADRLEHRHAAAVYRAAALRARDAEELRLKREVHDLRDPVPAVEQTGIERQSGQLRHAGPRAMDESVGLRHRGGEVGAAGRPARAESLGQARCQFP